MKINTYKEYNELYKKAAIPGAGIADEGAQAVRQLIKRIDEAGDLASPGFKALLEGLGESASGMTRDITDIFGYIQGVLDEAVALQKQIDSGDLVRRLKEAEDSLSEAHRLRKKHYQSYLRARSEKAALAEQMTEVSAKYQEALKEAVKETSEVRKHVDELTKQVETLTREGGEAYAKLSEAEARTGKLTQELTSIQKALTEATQRADTAESALELLRKEHAELTALYEKTLKEADEAQEALKAAQEAGVSGPVVDGLKATADAKKSAAVEIGSRLAKGDSVAQEALERSAREARSKAEAPTPKAEAPKAEAPRAETPGTPDVPKADSSKPKTEPKSGIPSTIGEAASKGFREGVKESFKDIAEKGVASVAGGVLKLLGGLALFAFVGLPILAYAGYTLWGWYVSQDIDAARVNARDFDRILRDAHAKLSKVRFKRGTRTYEVQQSYLEIMQNCFGLFPEMVERADDDAFVKESGLKIQILLQQTETFLGLKDIYAMDLETPDGWEEAIVAIQRLDAAGKKLHDSLEQAVNSARDSQQARPGQGARPGGGVTERQRPEPSPDDKGINVLGQKVYLSQYPELDPATRSAAPYLISKVLLSPTGLSFWDPEGKWGGGYLRNNGSISDQVIKHVRFFLNPRAVDSDWAYGPINNERKLRKFMRKNMPKAGRKPGSGYKDTRREYRKNKPRLAFSNNINISNMDSSMKNRENRLKMLEKIASSTNRTAMSTESIEKYADSFSKEYYQGALRGLDDQYAKSYYTGLKSMYDQKLGGGKADYKSLYEPHGGTGTEILESSHPKSVVVSDAMGNGGLVENVLEQQRHDIGVALSTPTGNFRGKHANLISALTKIANMADGYDNVDPEISELVDNAIEDIASILKG